MDYTWRSLAVSLLVGAIQCALSFGNNDNTTYSVIEDTGLGPICYACDLMVTPNDCMQTVQCGRDEMCMLYELIGVTGGEKRFRANCGSAAICHSLENHAKRESRVFCHNCCLEDRCNNHCGETPTQPPAVTASTLTTTSTTSTTTTATTTTTTTTTIPPATATSMRTTPSPTVQAPVCYQCNAIVDPGHCYRFIKCASGEVCILHQTDVRSDTGQMLYNADCIRQSVCDVFGHLQGNTHQTDYCLTCCSTDLCNNKCVTHVTSTNLPDTTTHAPDTALKRSRCEHNGFLYIPYVDLCVKLVDVKHTYSVAASLCQYYGGMMAVIDTQGKYDALQSFLKYADHFANTRAYIGAHSVSPQNHILYWPNGKLVTGIWFGLNFNHPTADCMALDGSVGFTAQFVACNNMYNFICTKEV